MSDSTTAAAGWYPETDAAWERYWDGAGWTDERRPAEPSAPLAPGVQPVGAPPAAATRIGAGEIVQPPPGHGLVPGTHQVRPLVVDNGGWHFLRFLFFYVLMGLTVYLLVGFIWWMIALAQTGRRKRDLLLIAVPIYGAVVAVQTMWRYTAKNVYWSARADRPSKSLFAAA